MKKALLIVCFSTLNCLYQTSAMAELSGNIAISSDYLLRGITQTNHQSAVSGGGDYNHDSGLYAGSWISNVTDDTEIDVYAGFTAAVADMTYDVGYIYFHYPQVIDDAAEAYLRLKMGGGGLELAYDSQNESLYTALSYAQAVKSDLTMKLVLGQTDWKDAAIQDYVHYSVAVEKQLADGWTPSFTVSATDLNSGPNKKPMAVIAIRRAFEL